MSAAERCGALRYPKGMALSPARKVFSRELLGTREWYDELTHIFSAQAKAGVALAFIDALYENLKIDSALVLHFPKDEGPRLIFSKIDSKRRSNSLDDYFGGNYVLDPFYLRLNDCRDRYVLSLREVIEENFSQSEYYRVHYKAAGLIDELCFSCDDRQSGHVLLSLSRAQGHQPFAAAEIAAVRIIAPLLLNVLGSSWQDLRAHLTSDTEIVKITSELHRHLENARLNFGRSLLTRREFGVIQLIMLGNSVELISKKMNISVETVKVHRKHIYQKLNIKSQAEVFSLFLDVVSSTFYEPNCDPLDQYMRRR
ncbi:helix-turn-helix transcriptional regulator [Sphingosinicella microcystinivorans]|uniref:helix-turn-helix transcriptional regulator n=1 Tax=Sphingosinicella microcystinivorans TaxID=335406 RepID=UPI0022F3E98B|nr:helix-turn-helix transcriptional regulator [Sphingosinicella microcystinivorans]WBX85189.1 helix-turn-helix transcriptional regulator [Sphingosinicella microcystinivorans]